MLCSGSRRVPPLDKSLDADRRNPDRGSVSPGQRPPADATATRRWATFPKVMSLTVDSALTSENTLAAPRSLENPKVEPGNDRGPLRSLEKGL